MVKMMRDRSLTNTATLHSQPADSGHVQIPKTFQLTTTMDDTNVLVNIKSPPATTLVSTESATAADVSFAQALNDPNIQPDEVCQ